MKTFVAIVAVIFLVSAFLALPAGADREWRVTHKNGKFVKEVIVTSSESEEVSRDDLEEDLGAKEERLVELRALKSAEVPDAVALEIFQYLEGKPFDEKAAFNSVLDTEIAELEDLTGKMDSVLKAHERN